MAFYRSTSLRQVILIGFSVVTLPLITGLVTALIAVDQLTARGQQAILAATDTIRSSRILAEDLTAMERHARQFQVLRDPALYQTYGERREQFRQNIQQLLAHGLAGPLRLHLERLMNEENMLFQALREVPPGSPAARDAVEGFQSLNGLVRTILAESSQLVRQETETMQQAARAAQRLLLWLALLLILLAFVLAGIFTGLVARPMRQLDRGIRQLGDGKYASPIHVAGPDDIENLGKQLEWLRLRLLQLEQQKVSFLRHVSHELKTPLASVHEGVGLLRDRVVGPLTAEQAEVAQILQQNTLQLQRRIEDLINLSLAERHAVLGELRPVALHRLVNELVNVHKLAAKAKGIVFDLDIDPVTVSGEDEKLRTVLDNLLSNAIKYSPTGGKISVRLRCRDASAELEVCDEGPGIDADERERIFEAFYQGRAIAKGHIKGSGLGLSIAQEYVRLHGGNIEARETARGAHLHVTLPRATEAHPTHESAQTIEV